MYEEEQSGPSNYIPTLLKYKWQAVVAVSVLFILTTAVVLSLTPIYRSSGTVLVETQQIPTDLVRSTVTSVAAERIEVIKQRVMTRDRLKEIIEKYSYFDLKDKSPAALTRQLEGVRSAVAIQVIEGVTSRRGPTNAIAFQLSFDSENPFIAQAVANDLVTLFLSENVRVRTERASQTTDFLEDEARKIKLELDATESAVADFKQQNKDALPEHLSLYVDIREESSKRLAEIERDIRATKEQVTFIQSQKQLISGDSKQGGVSKVEILRQELSRLLLVYKPAHPDIVEVKRQIAFLESSQNGSTGGAQGYNVSELGIRQQLSDLNSKLASLEREKRIIEKKITDTEERILRIPQVERELVTLTRENESKINQYNILVAKSMEAGVAESLEEGLKAERFSLLEPPLQPVTPYKPDRKKLLALSTAFSFGLPIGLILMLGHFNKNIIGINALNKVTNIPVLAEVPHIYTDSELVIQRKRTIKWILIAAFFIVLSTLSLHFLYMPLGELTEKALLRVGL